jgi:hypothetical protein
VGTHGGHDAGKPLWQRIAIAGAGLFVGVLGLGHNASAQTTDELRNFFRTDPHFFQWDFDDPSQASGNAPVGTPEHQFMVSPKLNNSNFAQVDAILRQSGPSNPNFWQSVTVQEDLTSTGAIGIFYLHRTTLTFADLEPDFGARTRNLANQQAASAWSRGVELGNFDLLPPNLDVAPQQPMLNPSLYPGNPGFGDPSVGAANTRTGLFMSTIRKLTNVESSNTGNLLLVPWATRFNNWGNDSLDTDHNPANGYQFVTPDQLPNRDDFAAQLLHYRLRGADSVHLFQPGVQTDNDGSPYTMAEMREDMIRGWFGPNNIVQNMFNDPATHVSTLTTDVHVDGTTKSMEQAGVIYSAVNNNNTLGMVLSNMDSQYHYVNFADTFGPGTLNMDIGLAPGVHMFVRFALNNGHWQAFDYSSLGNSTASRSGVGIPEPGTFSLMAGAGALVLLRRRRHSKK